jgi:RNA polymerase sigma factor (sigma-70 family)
MPSEREAKPSGPSLLNSIDRLGRPIHPGVLSVAQEISHQALAYAERILGDPAVALNLFEEAAAAVSKAVETKKASGKPPIRDPRAYLFRAYVRRISQERRREVVFEHEVELRQERNRPTHNGTGPDMKLLLDEVMAAYDKVTQEITLRRLEGFSWDEIGDRYGISSHAARIRFSKALKRARKTFKARGVGG